MKLKIQRIISIILVIIAFKSFYFSSILNTWSEENLNPCCIEICGDTTNVLEECLPLHIAGLLIVFGILLIILAALNFIDFNQDNNVKNKWENVKFVKREKL